jgi:hypothetical protein
MKRYSRTLFPPLDHDYSTLALRPVLISGLVTPVAAGDGGVNISIVQDNPNGVLTAVDPWLRMQLGDRVDIYWDGVPVGGRDVIDADIDKRMFFYLPPDPIQPDWAEKVFYSLTRVGSTVPEESVPLRLRVKLDRPAGKDRDPHLPGHSELAAPQLPPDVITNGVDAEWAKKGVPVTIATYPGRAARDTVELRWGVVSISRSITEGEAAGTDPIVITVDQDAILAAGDSTNLLVHYQVYDEVWNFSEQWSLQTFVPVDAGAWKLPAPIIQEAINGEIDLGNLGSATVTVSIPVTAAPFERDDTVTMTWLGTTAAGAPLTYSQSVTLTNIPAIYETTVPNALVRELINGTAQASYVLTKANGDPPQSSKRAAVRITGVAPLQIPRILELIGDVLDPFEERAHVEIPVYDGMANGDLIDLAWLGTRVDGAPYLYETQHIVTANDVGNVVYIPVMGEHIALLENGTLDVSYRVSNDAWQALDVRVSEHLLVRVGQHVAELPAPIIVEAPDGVLDPEVNRGDVTLRVNYPGTVAGDRLTWYWLGQPLEGSGSDWIPITTAIAGKPVDFTIARSLVEPNINNEVRVLYTLERGATGTFQYSATLNLVIGKLIGDLPAPTVVEASAGVLDPINALAGATVRVSYASMEAQDLVTLAWLGSPGTGTPADQEKPGSASGQVEFTVPATVVGANIGREVSVSYRVKRYTSEKQSDALRLPVLPFGNPDKDLPHPVISQANSQTMTLNLATFTGNATTTVAKWPFSLAGQRVWLRLEGETGSGGVYTITLLDGVAVTSGQASTGLSESALRAELEKLGQDTRLTVVCNVAFDGTASESTAVQFPRTAYTFKLHHDWVSPQILSIKDSKGEVADGGTTFDNTVSISGTSTLETELEILDGATRLTTVKANNSGVWSVPLPGLTVKSYSLTARALDGSGLVSQPRRFVVAANLMPTITQVLDASGPVSNGGSTVESSVTLSGKASPNQQLELFDGTVSKGRTGTDAAGTWSALVTGLAVGSHGLKAKALYGDGLTSSVWTVNVAQDIAPTITRIVNSAGVEIPEGGSTVDTSVTLTGAASANFEVQILDGTTVAGTAKANNNGQWTFPLTGLALTTHVMTAKALYGGGTESARRTFTVTASLAPTITSITDSQGSDIPPDGITIDTRITLTGTASAGLDVQILDGTSDRGSARVAANGQWTLTLSGLSVAAHAIKAKALYGTGAESAVRRFTIIASVAPTITSIKDSKNVEIPPDGFTVDTSVVLTGTASAGLEVEVFDGAVSQDIITANASGQWTLTLTGMSVARHDMKVRANYGSNPESAVRKFTVTTVVTPTITRVDDPQGSLVSNGGSTFADAVTASGKASIGQSVEVFDGASSKGTASVNASGDWSRSVSGLSVGAHSLTAKALYASNPVSSPWTFNVQAATVPTLSVRDSRGEIAQGGTTTEITVTASGTAVANEQVEVFDASTSKGTTAVGGTGGWSLAVAVALGTHSIKVVGKYADSPSSGTRDFTVVSPIPDFVLDPTPVSLNGGLYRSNTNLSVDPLTWPAGTTAVRVPTSGAPTYTYTSSNPAVARVDSNGVVYSVTNGSATITVRDSAGRSGSYTVTVSGVVVVYTLSNATYAQAQRDAAANGKRIPNMNELRAIYNQFGNGRFPQYPDRLYSWSTDGAGLFKNATKNLVTGAEDSFPTHAGSYANCNAI